MEHGFDRRHTIRTILQSRAYQASFRTTPLNQDDSKYASHFQPRLLSAEQLLDAICAVTDVPETFGSLPPGTKATQIPAPDLAKNEFLKTFGQPERQTVCACERSSSQATVGTPPAVDAKVGKVEKASGADARTISELWEQKNAMGGKTVTIRHIDGPVGVQSRNFANGAIEKLGFRANFPLRAGIERTYPWVAAQVEAARAAG